LAAGNKNIRPTTALPMPAVRGFCTNVTKNRYFY
jgi:hypothetical protein